jgi:hypothetical protein
MSKDNGDDDYGTSKFSNNADSKGNTPDALKSLEEKEPWEKFIDSRTSGTPLDPDVKAKLKADGVPEKSFGAKPKRSIFDIFPIENTPQSQSPVIPKYNRTGRLDNLSPQISSAPAELSESNNKQENKESPEQNKVQSPEVKKMSKGPIDHEYNSAVSKHSFLMAQEITSSAWIKANIEAPSEESRSSYLQDDKFLSRCLETYYADHGFLDKTAPKDLILAGANTANLLYAVKMQIMENGFLDIPDQPDPTLTEILFDREPHAYKLEKVGKEVAHPPAEALSFPEASTPAAPTVSARLKPRLDVAQEHSSSSPLDKSTRNNKQKGKEEGDEPVKPRDMVFKKPGGRADDAPPETAKAPSIKADIQKSKSGKVQSDGEQVENKGNGRDNTPTGKGR